MKQLQFTFSDDGQLEAELQKARQWYINCLSSAILFRIFTEVLDRERIGHVLDRIREVLPQAWYAGCSSNGNIVHGDFSGGSIAVVCTFFEYPTTKLELLQYPLSEENMPSVAQQISREVSGRGWVRAVEILTTIRNMSMTALCEGLSDLDEEICIYGGGAFSEDINATDACVFSSVGGYQKNSIVVILLGGDHFHIQTSFITGWKPLGLPLNVTAADGCILKELNHQPAYDTYYRYLHIQNNKDFFFNTLEFPFIYHDNGIDIMRAPTASLPDGSLVMTSDIPTDVTARIAYGDPWTILDSARAEGQRLKGFAPECILVYSCAARRTFWGNQEVGKETAPYEAVAPTSGFYTSGEFLRSGKYLNQHNVTQVIAAMREGDSGKTHVPSTCPVTAQMEGKVSMIRRMATFIMATSEELEEANRRLSVMAVTDGLTGLLNRREIQNRICLQIDERKAPDTWLVMLDIDNFKKVNDTFGHQEGDQVIVGLASVLKEITAEHDGRFSAGRWGGEEFMLLMISSSEEEALEAAATVHRRLAEITFEQAGHITVSIGVTKVLPSEPSDAACSRVDHGLYQAKTEGKNRTKVL